MVYKEPTDVAIKKVSDKYNVTVRKSNKSKNLQNVSHERKIVRDGEAGALERIFGVILDANWEDFKQAYGSDILDSLYYAMQMNRIDLVRTKENLVSALSETNPIEIVAA